MLPTRQQVSRINDVLYFIHQDISKELLARDLARVAAYSEQHFHRVFKVVVGEAVHHYIRRTRLEFAANQLMFDASATVLDVATKSGFSSVSSFSRAFKTTFNCAPGQWRHLDFQGANSASPSNSDVAAYYQRISHIELPKCELRELPPRHVAYIRHQGYDRSISNAWHTLKAWAAMHNVDFSQQFGLHHSNPAWVALDKCRYVACLAVDSPITRRGIVNGMTIPGGLHAVFKLEGKYGELLPQLSNILANWLPTSGFKMQSTPAYVHYQKNQFLEHDEHYKLDFCLPIALFN